ncbi:MAG: hypothetical protein ABFD82_12450 [Syntrophaceae bacterium]
MKTNDIPITLKIFIENGNSIFRRDDGDWNVKIEPAADSHLKKDIPANALIIAHNGCGDYLFICMTDSAPKSFGTGVFVYWHEEHRYELYADNIHDLTNPAPAKPSEYKPIYYYGGTLEVQLGDEVSARDFLLRKNGRIVYLPGVSKKNRNMEYGGLSWVGIRFQKGTFSGTIVDSATFQLKKSVRFLRRSSEPVKELEPDEEFE